MLVISPVHYRGIVVPLAFLAAITLTIGGCAVRRTQSIPPVSALAVAPPPTSTSEAVEPDHFRLVTVARIQYNDCMGGTVEITLPENQSAALPFRIQLGDGQSCEGSTSISNAGRVQVRTLDIVPEMKDGITQTTLSFKTSDMPKAPADPSQPSSSSYSSTSTISTNLGKKPFIWALHDGVYTIGQSVRLGTIAGKPVTLTIGTKTPKR